MLSKPRETMKCINQLCACIKLSDVLSHSVAKDASREAGGAGNEGGLPLSLMFPTFAGGIGHWAANCPTALRGVQPLRQLAAD